MAIAIRAYAESSTSPRLVEDIFENSYGRYLLTA